MGKQTNEQVSMASARRDGELGDDLGAPAPGLGQARTEDYPVLLLAQRRRLRYFGSRGHGGGQSPAHGDNFVSFFRGGEERGSEGKGEEQKKIRFTQNPWVLKGGN
jgi:hypothetical protein